MVGDTSRQEIVIRGAGLSGLTTALLLARQGRRVRVVDRASVPASRFAGGFQILESFSEERDVLDELRGYGFPTGFDLVEARRARFFWGADRSVEAASERPYAYFVRRGDVEGGVDRHLVHQLRELGGVVELDSRLDTDCDVVASGPQGQLDGWAREVVFSSPAEDTVDVHFDQELAPFGYGYCFVIDGHGTAGIATMGDPRGLPARLERFLARLSSRHGLELRSPRVRSYGMSFFLGPSALSPGAPLRVGEAAGFQDPLFGLANRMAIRSAVMVSKLIAGEDAAELARALRRRQVASLALRLAYRVGGRVTQGFFCSRVGSRDLRRALHSMVRYRPLHRFLFATVARWLDGSGDCRHPVRAAHWCMGPWLTCSREARRAGLVFEPAWVDRSRGDEQGSSG